MISVIVPVYNAEKTIERCVSSIQTQSYKDIEIILVNDGSKDASLILCQKMQKTDSRIKIIDTPNGGVSFARNLGIKMSKGQYIMFVDSDDYVEPEWCEKLYGTISRDESLGICNVLCKNVETNVDEVQNELHCEHNILEAKDFWEVFKLNLLHQPYNKIYSNHVIKDNNILFDESISLGEDLIFNLEYLQHISKINIINEALYNYTIAGNESLCRRYYKNFWDIQRNIYLKLKECFERFEVRKEQWEEEYYYSYMVTAFNALENNYSKQANLGLRERLLANREIINSLEFKGCIKRNKSKKQVWIHILRIRSAFIYEIYHRYINRNI